MLSPQLRVALGRLRHTPLIHGYATAATPPTGTGSPGTRLEHDTMGSVEVPADALWGAQTQRSLQNFRVGDPAVERMPEPLIRALGLVKRAAATVNMQAGVLRPELGKPIVAAAAEVAQGKLMRHFPLIVWQTGSATQTNMNVNEVVANRAMQLLGEAALGDAAGAPTTPSHRVHPNDHVNMGQSSNDVIPTAMHVAAAVELQERLLPSLAHLHAALQQKEHQFADIIKVGRTHAQDATPLTLGAEFSGYAAQVKLGQQRVQEGLQGLLYLGQGATAVGTGLNTWKGFDQAMASQLSKDTNLNFKPATNKYEAIAAHDALVHAHGALNTVAVSLFKIANDIRLLASGPRCGIGELVLPSNEPGSSIMPGKVNPTQAEMLTMVCCQVFGNQTTVTVAGSQGLFELNAYKPVIIANVLRSVRLLADAAHSFADKAIADIQPNKQRIALNLANSLMNVTPLAPHIGYEKAAAVAKQAYAQDTTLRAAALAQGVQEQLYDDVVVPSKMLGPYALDK